jgi:hypothetical protein
MMNTSRLLGLSEPTIYFRKPIFLTSWGILLSLTPLEKGGKFPNLDWVTSTISSSLKCDASVIVEPFWAVRWVY